MKTSALSDVHMQIMWNRLISVVEEQAVTLIRTAFSTSVRESGDLSAGVFNRGGKMIAQAVTGTPGHVNAMAEAVGHFIRDIGPENIFEGDVYITNDPWKGTGHLHDFTVVSPSFRNGGLVGYFACTAHVVDVGGRGFGPDANEVYEEGIFVPIMKFAERGKVNKDLVNILHNNVRESHQVVGDVYSLAACNEIGHRRLMDMMEEFELADLETLGEFIFKRSYDATIERIAALPKGSYSNTMRVDGYGSPIDIAVRLDVAENYILADFEGTSPPSPKGINCPIIYSAAYACYGMKCSIAPEIPNNHASLLPFRVTAPENCILNAQHPAPVSVRHVLGHLVPDAVLGAVHKMLPGKVPAEGAGALWNLHVSVRPLQGEKAPADGGQRAEVLLFNSGGAGARSTLDGLSATAFPSGVHSMSIEATEHVGPVIFWRKELRDGSGGAGKFRGGLGQVVEISPTDGHEMHFNAMFDRVDHPPRGREGGANGAAGAVMLDDGTILATKGRQHVPAGRRLILQLPGGGGYGAPDKRDPTAAQRDRDFDYVPNS
ncbi:hydantoinase B/oxoprolinase family protein [Neorhizobium galegae]|uniref:hydantoinase B/oxoprolinase family protein n=1 Tax=Neorhizobium galegae TaxID=399 RepID=UPI0006223098|nr:hydantoinase B/oxoprolinase family protein [Neorhizobium galegae]CDZ64703.1 N-methylhydantoinase B [Neorhizobium galegae bv. orientalis]KAB1119884.1 hydantoinase B/oxoprolinase family protein [Neorhizobium galegae]MCQ1810662.1 hydantoinase B/oxoprolinase family protein [Neorhizobium galegae]MCQ1839374.1 hydantoinase B/oxoprolinase family protein [Neorhizobium galegae]UIY31588.1 hydantoinase B/oxoprolinase family protein [Neorhizobium galegae]